jgi:competence protein ComFB
MVELKNIAEDIVFDLIDGLNDTRNGALDKNQRKEIAAFVLNRLKPMYITSNKGFNNVIVKYQKDPQFVADIMLRISEALKIVKKSSINYDISENLKRDRLYYIFPKIYGRIVSSKELLPLDEARVSLFIDNNTAETLFDFWKNPTEISPRDEGIFSFAPKPIIADPPFERKSFILSIRIEKGQEKYDKVFSYDSIPSLPMENYSELSENVLQLEDIYVPF